ncbi:alpha/beta fold hydrolase [Rhodococcus ruber]
MPGATTRSFVLLPGAGSDSWYWHRVAPLLRGHEVVPVDLPYTDPGADQYAYADVVVAACRDLARPPTVVAQSMSAFTAAIVAERMPVHALVLVAPMIPAPGESPGQWWSAVGQAEAKRAQDVADGRDPDAPLDPHALFFHDVPDDVVDEAFAHEQPDMAESAFEPAWRARRWPDVPVRVIAGRHDRLFPLPLIERLAHERLGVEPEVIDTGHLPALARPAELASLLLRE